MGDESQSSDQNDTQNKKNKIVLEKREDSCQGGQRGASREGWSWDDSIRVKYFEEMGENYSLVFGSRRSPRE